MNNLYNRFQKNKTLDSRDPEYDSELDELDESDLEDENTHRLMDAMEERDEQSCGEGWSP